MNQSDVKLSSFVEKEDEQILIFINLTGEKDFSMIIEFADITDEFWDLSEINDHYEIYDNMDDLTLDLEVGHLERFMGLPKDNPKLDLLINLRMKMKHERSICGDQCILCNPDIGDDPFPDFVFNIRNAEPEGES